ncbi:hypothetical protein BKA83DRAFT_4462509 [Pisolithus microcarpus]|nr:hypothetical protein BKA83DRAFT_4462509 [Pisolithus microcarpus]
MSFHCHQAIEQHFVFWDADKYAALTISSLTFELDIIKKEFNLIDDDFIWFHVDECKYLANLKQPVLHDQLLICYTQILDELEVYCTEWDSTWEAANNALSEVPTGNLQELAIMIKQSCVCVDTTYAKLQHAETHTSNMEMHLGIQPRWEISSEEYKCYKTEATMRLVVMWLFELSKMAMSGTGYKLRQQISKALQRRSEAICNAISCYNMQAAALNPPHPLISWKDIAEYSFLGEFNLLHHCCADVRDNNWAKPAFWQAMSTAYGHPFMMKRLTQ